MSDKLITENLDARFKELQGFWKNMTPSSSLVDMSKSQLSKLTKYAATMKPGLVRQSPSFYHPLFERINLQLPTKTREINQWCRHFYKTDGYVGNLIDLHSIPEGEIVYTKNGISEIQNITLEDKVINQEGIYQDVLMTDNHSYKGDLYTFKVFSLLPFSVTDMHPIKVACGKFICSKEIEQWNPNTNQIKWVFAKDISKNDYFVIPKYKYYEKFQKFDLSKYITKKTKEYTMDVGNQFGKGYKKITRNRDPNCFMVTENKIIFRKTGIQLNRYIDLSKELCELCGWYVSEGYNNGSSQIAFCLHSNEKEYIDRIRFLIEIIFGLKTSIREFSDKQSTQVILCNGVVSKWFKENFGVGAYNKRVPLWLLGAELDCIRSFVKSYFCGDGCFNEKYDVSSNTVSKILAYQLGLLGNKLGFLFHTHIQIMKNGHTLYCVNTSHRLFSEKILLQEHRFRKHHSNYYEDESSFYVKVRDIIVSQYDGIVYDIKTPDHSFAVPFIIHNSEFPLTGSHISCDDPKIKKFYEILFYDVLRGEKLMLDINQEYWKIANVFPFGEWDENKGIWTRFVLLNPDFVEVEKSMLVDEPILKLDPDDNLKRIVQSRQPRELYDKLAQIQGGKIVNLIARGEKIPLNQFRVSHIAYKLSPYETVGTPIMFRAFKPLIYKDILRRVQIAIGERHITPIKVVKVGTDQIPATPEAVQAARDAFEELNYDLSSWFFYHHAISFEYVSSAGKIQPLDREYTWIEQEITAALLGSKTIIDGSGPNFATASVALRILINRYLRNQEILKDWIKNYVFRPVAIKQEFKRINEWGDEEYIIPDIEFEFMNLRDDTQQKQLMKELMKMGLCSKQTYFSYIGLNWDKEKKIIAKEQEDEKKQKTLISPVKPEKKPGVEIPEIGGIGEGMERLPPMPEEIPMGGPEVGVAGLGGPGAEGIV